MKTDILGQLLEAVIKSEGQVNKSTDMLILLPDLKSEGQANKSTFIY